MIWRIIWGVFTVGAAVWWFSALLFHYTPPDWVMSMWMALVLALIYGHLAFSKPPSK